MRNIIFYYKKRGLNFTIFIKLHYFKGSSYLNNWKLSFLLLEMVQIINLKYVAVNLPLFYIFYLMKKMEE